MGSPRTDPPRIRLHGRPDHRSGQAPGPPTPEGVTGGGLLDFVDNTLFSALKGMEWSRTRRRSQLPAPAGWTDTLEYSLSVLQNAFESAGIPRAGASRAWARCASGRLPGFHRLSSPSRPWLTENLSGASYSTQFALHLKFLLSPTKYTLLSN